jgi:copper resistance protein C
MKTIMLAVTLIVALCAGIVPAAAHAHLEHASPAIDSTVTGAPAEVRIWFTQALETEFSGAELRSAEGAVVAKGHVDPKEAKQMVIPLHGLPAGKYKVFWKAVSVDTHRSEGNFAFEVK